MHGQVLHSTVKGIVYPKMKIFTHPHVVPNLYEFLLWSRQSAEDQTNIKMGRNVMIELFQSISETADLLMCAFHT